MIFIDTNVISELMLPEPNGHVLAWANDLQVADVGISAVVLAEIRAGIARLPKGKRQSEFSARAEGLFSDLVGHVVGFLESHSESYALIARARRQAGLHFPNIDSLIAATALFHGAALATRNTSDFEGVGLTLINPWDYPVT